MLNSKNGGNINNHKIKKAQILVLRKTAVKTLRG